MAGAVDQREAQRVLRRAERDRGRVDGDAALRLEPLVERARPARLLSAQLAARGEEAVGQRRLAVVDMSDHRDVPHRIRVHLGRSELGGRRGDGGGSGGLAGGRAGWLGLGRGVRLRSSCHARCTAWLHGGRGGRRACRRHEAARLSGCATPVEGGGVARSEADLECLLRRARLGRCRRGARLGGCAAPVEEGEAVRSERALECLLRTLRLGWRGDEAAANSRRKNPVSGTTRALWLG
mmetsp:Transcript_24620/g.63569  ORF Transcript_24620/g.63569 Transcript_24620/m.63569 type:complete len:238 (+) Transcript_24620:2712-3425(+)